MNKFIVKSEQSNEIPLMIARVRVENKSLFSLNSKISVHSTLYVTTSPSNLIVLWLILVCFALPFTTLQTAK
jgi:hypothetical protein